MRAVFSSGSIGNEQGLKRAVTLIRSTSLGYSAAL
jgi:hypothetical protein